MAYIERDIFINNELIPLVKRLDLCHPKQKKGVLMAISKLKEAPTADVVEVRHSYWQCSNVRMSSRDITCRYCHRTETINNGNEDFEYCPHCGAKMDGKDEE